jgi:hypothetical protein
MSFNSSKHYRGEIKDLVTKFNAWNEEAVLQKAKFGDSTYNPQWQNYSPEHQKELTNKVRADLLTDYKAKASKLKEDILKNRKYIIQDIGKIKFPNLSSESESTRLIGETQTNSAIQYLATAKPSPAILETIKEAFNLNRTDFAFTIADRIMSNYFTKKQIEGMSKEEINTNLEQVKKSMTIFDEKTPEGKLIQGITEVLTAFPGKAKLDELQTELENFTPLEKSADSIINQLNDRRTIIQAPGIWNDLNEKERQEMIAGLHGLPLVQRVAFTRMTAGK